MTSEVNEFSHDDITTDAIENHSMMAKCDVRNNLYISLNLTWRGSINPAKAGAAFKNIYKKVHFVGKSPTAFLQALASQAMHSNITTYCK